MTYDGTSPLRIALDNLGPSHTITKFLQDRGAEDRFDDDGGDDEAYYDDDDGGGHFFGDSNNAEEQDHPGEDIVPSIVNNNPRDVVPTIVKIEEEIVPTIRRIGEKIAEKTPEIVPTIVGTDDVEEL